MRLTPTGTLASWVVFVDPLVLTLFIIRRISSALTVPSSCSSSFKTLLCAHHEERGVKRRGGERRERGRKEKGERRGGERRERGRKEKGERRERGRKEREEGKRKKREGRKWRRKEREGEKGKGGERRDRGKWWTRRAAEHVVEAKYPRHLLELKFRCYLKVSQWGKFRNVTRTVFCIEPVRKNIPCHF